MKSNLIPYSMDFASFLIQKTKDKKNIKNIILFGSVSRGEEEENSDIDIFIDLIIENKHSKKDIDKILNEFLNSTKNTNYWNLLGVKNEINLTIGKLTNWKELNASIISNGITLYGKFKADIKQGNHKTFFIWENIKPNSKRVLFNKKMFGYKLKDKHYSGILEKYNGEKLGKGCISVDLDHYKVLYNLFKKYKITVKIKKVLEY